VIAGILRRHRPDTPRAAHCEHQGATGENSSVIDDLRGGERWSPYYRKDPAMQGTYTGPAKGVGATFSYAGNKDVGSGRVSITGARPRNQVTMRLQMFAVGGQYRQFTLSWRADHRRYLGHGRPAAVLPVMCLFFDMDKMIGTDFAAGLANLKTIAEAPIAIAQGEKA
jgi:hypothetical protein